MTDPDHLPPDCATERECDQLAMMVRLTAGTHDKVSAIIARLLNRAAYFQALHGTQPDLRDTIKRAAAIGADGNVSVMEGHTKPEGRPVYIVVGIGDGAANLHATIRKVWPDELSRTEIPPPQDTPNRKGPGQ